MSGKAIVITLMLAIATAADAATTDQQGRPIAHVCDIPNYADILRLAGGAPPASAIVVLDLTGLNAKNENSKVYFFSSPAPKVIAEAVANECGKAAANRDFVAVQSALLNATTASPARWVSRTGDTVWIFALIQGSANKKIHVVETRRATKLASDLADLLKLAKKAGFAGPAIDLVGFPYTLRETRADVAIQIMDSDEKNAQTALSLTTGPKEHFSLSANIPLNTIKQVKLDDNNNIVTREAPKEFLVGLNYSLGDVFLRHPTWSKERVLVTGMVRFSKEPLDTLGLGVGYRFGMANVFAGPIWIRQPREAAATTAADTPSDPEMEYKMNWRIGIAFELKKALDWVTGK